MELFLPEKRVQRMCRTNVKMSKIKTNSNTESLPNTADQKSFTSSTEDTPVFQLLTIIKSYFFLLIPSLIAFVHGYYGFNALWIWIETGLWYYLVWKNEKLDYRAHLQKEIRDTFLLTKNSEKESVKREVLPAWMRLKKVEHAQWINEVLNKMWPFVKKRLEHDLTNRVVLPLALDYSAEIETFDLGALPPKFEGVRARKSSENTGIAFDLHLDFQSNFRPNHPEDVTKNEKFNCLGIENFNIKGVLRVELHRLTDRSPYIGAILFGFIEEPEIEFSFLKFPLFFKSVPIKLLIKKFIIKRYVLPNKYNLDLVDTPEIDPFFSMIFAKFQNSPKN